MLQALEALAKKNGVNLLDEGVIPPSASYEDYVHPNRGHALYNTNIALAAVTFCFVVARLWTRIRIAGGLGADDYTIILAIVSVVPK